MIKLEDAYKTIVTQLFINKIILVQKCCVKSSPSTQESNSITITLLNEKTGTLEITLLYKNYNDMIEDYDRLKRALS